MLITPETPYCHGITVCDEQGEPINRVYKFDTETYLCWMRNGKRAVAAAYAVFPVDGEHMQRCLDSLPDSMLPHVFPGLVKDEPDAEKRLERNKRFIMDQLSHRARLRALAVPVEEELETITPD